MPYFTILAAVWSLYRKKLPDWSARYVGISAVRHLIFSDIYTHAHCKFSKLENFGAKKLVFTTQKIDSDRCRLIGRAAPYLICDWSTAFENQNGRLVPPNLKRL